MEDQNRNLIREKLTQLVLHTDCNTNLVMFFHQNKILSVYDLEEIASKNPGQERATEFYKIIVTRTGSFLVLLQGLQRYRQLNALRVLTGNPGDKIELSPSEVKTRVAKLLREQPSKSSHFNVPPPHHLFSGRRRELQELDDMVMQSKNGGRVTVISQLVVICGPEGIGKTQLAMQYANEKGSDFENNVVWLDAESEASLTNSFRELAVEKVKIQSQDGNGNEKVGKTLAEEVYKYFEGSFVLFIFDNGSKNGRSWLRDFLPDPGKNKNFYTVMTSRGTQWGIGTKVLNLKGLEKEDAVEMVKMGLEIKVNDSSQDEDVVELAEMLEFIPARLHNAVEYVFDRNITDEFTIQDFIFEFKSKKRKVSEE